MAARFLNCCDSAFDISKDIILLTIVCFVGKLNSVTQ